VPGAISRNDIARCFAISDKLGDIEILKSYFLLVWSEWGIFVDDCLTEMEVAIGRNFAESRCGATGKISSNGWITFKGNWIGG